MALTPILEGMVQDILVFQLSLGVPHLPLHSGK